MKNTKYNLLEMEASCIKRESSFKAFGRAWEEIKAMEQRRGISHDYICDIFFLYRLKSLLNSYPPQLMAEAVASYRKKNEKGNDQDWREPFPNDGQYSWVGGREPMPRLRNASIFYKYWVYIKRFVEELLCTRLQYEEGRLDKAWMNMKEKKYSVRMQQENKKKYEEDKEYFKTMILPAVRENNSNAFFNLEKKLTDINNDLTCPITGERMKDPVTLQGSGHIYERSAIERWLAEKDTDPLTQKKLDQNGKQLLPNWTIKKLLESSKEDIKGYTK